MDPAAVIWVVFALIVLGVIVVAVRSGVGQNAGSFPYSNRHDPKGPGPGGMSGPDGLGGPGGA